jgi:uncharacterized protein involved in tolerance to divalent cations
VLLRAAAARTTAAAFTVCTLSSPACISSLSSYLSYYDWKTKFLSSRIEFHVGLAIVRTDPGRQEEEQVRKNMKKIS